MLQLIHHSRPRATADTQTSTGKFPEQRWIRSNLFEGVSTQNRRSRRCVVGRAHHECFALELARGAASDAYVLAVEGAGPGVVLRSGRSPSPPPG